MARQQRRLNGDVGFDTTLVLSRVSTALFGSDGTKELRWPWLWTTGELRLSLSAAALWQPTEKLRDIICWWLLIRIYATPAVMYICNDWMNRPYIYKYIYISSVKGLPLLEKRMITRGGGYTTGLMDDRYTHNQRVLFSSYSFLVSFSLFFPPRCCCCYL